MRPVGMVPLIDQHPDCPVDHGEVVQPTEPGYTDGGDGQMAVDDDLAVETVGVSGVGGQVDEGTRAARVEHHDTVGAGTGQLVQWQLQ